MSAEVAIIVNKWWEAAALISVFRHTRAIKQEFSASPSSMEVFAGCGSREVATGPRLICRIDKLMVEVWCIEDLIAPGENSSSTLAKRHILEELRSRSLFNDGMIIAFGTAASPKSDCAGNVVIGSSVFVYDALESSESASAVELSRKGGGIVTSCAAAMLNEKIFDQSLVEAEKRFLMPTKNPANTPHVLADSNLVSVGVINVPNNSDYKVYDQLALQSFNKIKTVEDVMSVETTHGLIRLCIDRPYLYVSGIANQVGRFDEEVRLNKYSQNFAASHNAAVCLAWMLQDLSVALPTQSNGG